MPALEDVGSQLMYHRPANLVSGRARVFWMFRAGLGWAVVLGVQVAILFLPATDAHRAVNLVVLAVSLVLAIAHLAVMPQWRYRVHRWEITDTACFSQVGWINQERRIAPLSRIQTVDSKRGPLEQLFRLTDVTVTTASAAGPIVIHGLDRRVAEAVVDQLTRSTGQNREDDAT